LMFVLGVTCTMSAGCFVLLAVAVHEAKEKRRRIERVRGRVDRLLKDMREAAVDDEFQADMDALEKRDPSEPLLYPMDYPGKVN